MKKELKTEEERIAYNCRKATLLIEKQQEIELTVREKMELQFHLTGCYICRVYEQQSILINRMIRQLFNTQKDEANLNYESKEKLKQKIAAKLDNN